jgi:hypothetical protein
VPYFLLLIVCYSINFHKKKVVNLSRTVNVPETVNVATLQPPAGAGNVVTVFVPGLAEIIAPDGALIITIPEPPAPDPGENAPAPPPPPVLAVPATPAF